MIKSKTVITSLIMMLGSSSVLEASQDDIINKINIEIQQHPSSTDGSFSDFLPSEKFMLMDFEDVVVHDKDWLSSQRNGYTALIVQKNKNTGANKLSIAIGEGRNGSNALLVESTNESMGLPSFSISKALKAKSGIKGITNKKAYLIPNNVKANRLEFWLRFEDGFRYNKSSVYPPSYPNHQNLLLRTHHFDPSKINGKTIVDKSDNWKFLHRVFLRHDKAGSGWIHVIINQQPQKQNKSKDQIPNNPTMPIGNYYNLLTKLYIDLAPYFSDPETPYPVKMWVDDIALSYVAESPDLTIDYIDHSQGDTINVLRSEERFLPINIKNNKSKEVCGLLSINAPRYFNSELLGNEGFNTDNTICLEANSSEALNLRILPNSKLPIDKTYSVGLTFVNEESILSDSESTNRSLTDNNVEKRWFSETGPHDSIVSSNFIKLKIATTLSNTDTDTETTTDTNTDTTTDTDTDTDTTTDTSTDTTTDTSTDTTTDTTTTPASTPTPTPGNPTDKFVIMDFEDSVIHDENWFKSQPKGYAGFFVKEKSEGSAGVGLDKLSVAIGEGRNGSNALLVESLDESMGLPAFFIIKSLNAGGATSRFKDKEGYWLPGNMKANRLEFWIRFENGFRSNSAAAQKLSYPNHRNFIIGTYHFDPAKINGTATVVESDNWHFYHQIFLRHDKANADWIHVVVNQQPQHIRGLKSPLPNNPTMPAGNYFEILTRLYVDLKPYFADPEKPYPVKMWVDDVALSYVPEQHDLKINIQDLSQGEIINANSSMKTILPVTISNNSSSQICGELSINSPAWLNPSLVDSNGVNKNNAYCLAANSSETLDFILLPDTTHIGKTYSAGLSFVNDQIIQSDSTSLNRSLTDDNVEKRSVPETGPHDGVVFSDFVQVNIQ